MARKKHFKGKTPSALVIEQIQGNISLFSEALALLIEDMLSQIDEDEIEGAVEMYSQIATPSLIVLFNNVRDEYEEISDPATADFVEIIKPDKMFSLLEDFKNKEEEEMEEVNIDDGGGELWGQDV